LTMLYRSTDRLCRRGAPVKNLSHSASFESLDKDAPSKPATKHPLSRRHYYGFYVEIFETIGHFPGPEQVEANLGIKEHEIATPTPHEVNKASHSRPQQLAHDIGTIDSRCVGAADNSAHRIPAIATGQIAISSRASSAKTCAIPRAPPPPSATATFGRRISAI
jgi:hypothetical protein